MKIHYMNIKINSQQTKIIKLAIKIWIRRENSSQVKLLETDNRSDTQSVERTVARSSYWRQTTDLTLNPSREQFPGQIIGDRQQIWHSIRRENSSQVKLLEM